MPDIGLTHVALAVADLDRSLDFYATYGGFHTVHRRVDPSTGHEVAWITDGTRPFVVVLMAIGMDGPPLGGANHLGVGLPSRAAVDDVVARARTEGRPVLGPFDEGPPVGYWAVVVDPDGHNLEVAHGQEVGLVVADDPVAPPA